MTPVPENMQLPSGWVCKRACGDELVLGDGNGGLEVAATRTGDPALVALDPMPGWELTCRVRAGESTSERVIGRVPTRTAAAAALRSCAERARALVRTDRSAEPAPVAVARELAGGGSSLVPE